MIKIMIDSGHGGTDSGAVGNGLQEKSINLVIGKSVAVGLIRCGFDVHWTRKDDTYVGLSDRAAMANKLGVDYFISLHVNSGGDGTASGFESFVQSGYDSGDTGRLRGVIHDEVSKYYASVGKPDRGKKQADLAVCRETHMPAALFENLFINNPDDAKLLKDTTFMAGLTEAYVRGICQAFGTPYIVREVQQPVQRPPEPTPRVTNTPIVGIYTTTLTRALEWAQKRGATQDLLDVAPIYWRLAPQVGVRADVAFCQSAKETNFGRFGGVVPRSYHNWCGLKTSAGGSNTDPNAHAQFASDEQGVLAHLQHLALYAGKLVEGEIVDPRHFASIEGKARYVEDLGGKWAPDPDYGVSIVRDYLTDLLTTPEPAPVQQADWAGHEFAKEIERVMAAGVMRGVDATHFKPDDVVTRGQLAAVAARLLDTMEVGK